MARGIIRDDVTDNAGNAQQGKLVTIYIADTTTKATLYDASTGGSIVGNPLTTDANGVFSAYAETGEYEAEIDAVIVARYNAIDADEVQRLLEIDELGGITSSDRVTHNGGTVEEKLDNIDDALDARPAEVADLAALKAVEAATFSGGERRNRKESTSGDGLKSDYIFRAGDQSANVATKIGNNWVVPDDLAADGSGGAWESIASEFYDRRAPAVLKVTSDIVNGLPCSVMSFIPRAQHAAIYDLSSSAEHDSYFQDAIDAGVFTLTIPDGRFNFANQVDYDASATRSPGLKLLGAGAGYTLLYNEVASGFLFDLNQSSASKFHLSSELKDFSIVSDTSPISSSGIRLRGAFFAEIERLLIDSLTGTGITILNDTSLDTDQNVHFKIAGSEIRSCGSWGLDMDYTTNTAFAYEVVRNRLISNAGGARLASAHGLFARNGLSESSTHPQVLLEHNGLANNYDMSINHNFFEKGRAGELEINGCVGGEIINNTFSSNDASSGSFAVKLGYDQQVRSMEIRRNRHIVHSSIQATYRCYDLGTGALRNEIIRPEYSDIGTATQVNFDTGAETNGNVITNTQGEELLTPRWKRVRETTAASSVTPDFFDGSFHHYFFSNSTVTINKPTNQASDGARWKLGIRNSTGGSLTVTFGTGITVQGYSDPANGVHTYAEFIYDSDSSTWRQVTTWN